MEKKDLKQILRRRVLLRSKLVGLVLVLTVAFLFGRIVYINVVYGEEYEAEVIRLMTVRHSAINRTIPAAHGEIFDRNNQPIAESEIVYTVALDVNRLHELSRIRNNPQIIHDALETIGAVLNLPLHELEAHLQTDAEGALLRPTFWRVLAHDVNQDTALELARDVAHIHLDRSVRRRHPDPFMAPQVIGFVRGDGIWGLENIYQDALTGQPGRVSRVFHTSDFTTREEEAPRDGYTLITTLDSGLQRIAREVVEDARHRFLAAPGTRRGSTQQFAALAIMQPHTGEILAMAQWPGFSLEEPANLDLFTCSSMHGREFAEHADDVTRYFWTNFFVSRTFQPGSTFKPFVIAAAIEEGAIDPHSDFFYCAGTMQVGDRELTCYGRIAHGRLSLREALAVSCNVTMFQIVQRMGRDNFYEYRNDFGFGHRTGIDLPGEEAVSSPLVMYQLAQLRPVELATSSMGQGFNNTAIQSLTAFAALINGGNVMRPHFVSQIVDSNGNTVHENRPTVVRQAISAETSDFLRTAMQDVVSTPRGTARRAAIEGFDIGGKTGTAQQQPGAHDWIVTSYMSYFPVDNPQFAAIAILYNTEPGLTGGSSAALMVRDAFERIIEYRQITPGAEGVPPAGLPGNFEPFPDFSGQYLRDVIARLDNLGLEYNVSGRGSIVASHIPPPGQPTPRHAPVNLYLDNDISDLDALVFVPDVRGLLPDRAAEIITDAGLVPIFTGDAAQVTGQALAPGLHIQRGVGVRVW